MRDRLTFLAMGGCLVLAGYLIGVNGRGGVAEAQTSVVTSQVRFFRTGDALITASDDGRTLHFWNTNERDTQLQVRPTYVTSVSAPASR